METHKRNKKKPKRKAMVNARKNEKHSYLGIKRNNRVAIRQDYTAVEARGAGACVPSHGPIKLSRT